MTRGVIAALSVIGFVVVASNSLADGIPMTTPLSYSGVLQNSAGSPVTAQQSMQLTLWDDATANASMNQKCVTPTQSITPDSQGRFQITLDQACFDAVKANPNLWVQVQVGAIVLPRSKLNAVPYAVESLRANRVVLNMRSFGADGGTRTTVDGVYCGATANTTGAFTAMAGALSGVRAAKALCEQTCGQPTAHMCKGSEAILSYELGATLPRGWVKAGTGAYYPYPGGFGYTNDCNGWSVSANGQYSQFGMAYNPVSFGQPALDATDCSGVYPILCCD